MPMPRRSKSASAENNRRQPGTSPHRATTTVKKPGQDNTTPKSLWSYNKSRVSHAAQSYPVQSSPTFPASLPQPVRTKRKRSPAPEVAERSANQPRRSIPPCRELSEKNLREFIGEEMDSIGNNAPAFQRTSSRRSILTSEADSVRSQRSSNTTANYRYKHLTAAEISIHNDTDPPDDIQAAINRVIKANVSEDRRAQLRNIAQEFYDGCKKAVKAAVGEDDFIDLFHTALKAMISDNLCLREKADWQEDLKPKIQQSDLNLSFLADFNAIVSDQQEDLDSAPARPRKRQQQYADPAPISPRPSSSDVLNSTLDNRPLELDTIPPSAMPLPALRLKETSLIKTPRPDISIGIQETALLSALSTALSLRNFNKTRAKRFLEKLQDAIISSEQGGPEEPALIAVPTQRASDLVFPFAVVEGKAYSTGKQVFEAQNQAAVSGASGLKIQLSLNTLGKRTIGSNILPLLLQDQPPLFFSVCTEGPYHELWAHYTYIEDNVLKFNQVLLEICNGMLLKSMVEFIVVVDNVLRWGTGPFLDLVVERLGMLARKAGA